MNLYVFSFLLVIGAVLFASSTSAIGISIIVIVLRSIVSACQQQLRVTQEPRLGTTWKEVAR